MDYNFFFKNLNCCSLELYWENCDKEKKENDSYDFEILKREKGCEYIQIYFGKDRFCEAINLIPNKEYIFKLNIKKDGERILKKKLNIITSNSPLAILSINSFKIANKEKIENNNFILSESQKNIINICSKLISEQNEDDIMIGNFNGIEIRIAYVKENDINLCYISFDIKPDYFNQFFLDLINECEDNVISPCHFILKKLSTILIFNLLEKGPVIFTGKRMGGIIASSLAFYILYKGKLMNKNYGNSFIKKEKNCIGVVTFGSPSFLTNLTAGFKMKEFTSYFYNIKHEFDYIPVIIDYLDKNTKYNELIKIFQKNELVKEDIKKLNYYLSEYNFIDYMTKTNKIPFGYYFLKKASDNTLIYQNEKNFYDFYYLKDIHQNKIISFLNIYKNLSFNIKFNSESLQFLEDKNYQIEFIKIIRRNNNIKNKSSDSMKGIIKIKIKEFENNYFTPDIISKIKLISNNTNYIINNKDIYYDNEYITAYIDNLNENINKVFIFNYFGGEIKVKNIINIMGSGSTREMLKNNIEKLFLFPFFKLIEIYYVSLNNEEKCNKLKKQNFGDNFNDLKFLKQFEKQIKTVDELLFLSRPDILGKNEKELINEFIGDELSNEQKKLFNNNLQSYYISALKLQLKQKINCLNSAKDTIAQETSFPYKFKDDVETKKLFMCEMTDLKDDLFNSEKIDDLYIKNFFIEQLIKRTLDCIDELIKKDLRDKDDNECKAYLDTSIGKLYNEHVLPNINFILFLILSSFEGGDEIIFNHNIDETKISFMILYPFIWLKPLGDSRATFEKDFEKHFSKNEIEEINMRNLFYKTKIRNFVDSNISPQNKNIKNKKSEKIKIFEIISTEQNKNKINDFCKYSENRIFGKGFYKSFLKLLNYNSNFFQEDIEISIYDNLKKENNNSIDNYKTIIEIMNNLIDDEESKKGFLALVRQSYLLGKLRAFIEEEFIIGVFGKKKSGKSTFIKKIFKECNTNSSYANSTLGLNLYKIKDIDNFSIIDSPGDTENNEIIEKFAQEGYKYSKMIFYLLGEEKLLDSDSLRNNKKLEKIIELRVKYKLQLLILLTHSDTYCNNVKNSEEENDWKKICEVHLNNNKNNLMDYINKLIQNKYKSDFIIKENDIIHISLGDNKKFSDEEIIKLLPGNLRDTYNSADENFKKTLLKFSIIPLEIKQNEAKEFTIKKINAFDKMKLIEKIKENLPSQYHNVFNV